MSQPDFVIENGVLTKYQGPGGDVIIPEGVTSISWWAFKGCSGLTSVTIPGSIAEIGSDSFGSPFRKSTGLKSVVIMDGVKQIWSNAFRYSHLEQVTILGNNLKIGTGSFGTGDFALIADRMMPSDIPSCYKKNYLHTFARRYLAGEEMEQNHPCFKYLKSQRKKLWTDLLLLRVILKEGYITSSEITDLISEAAALGDPELSAAILDYQNRNFSRAELDKENKKKFEREIRAMERTTPLVSELKKIWSCEKLESGGLRIKRYKGKETKIAIPDHIGKNKVVEIGDKAFQWCEEMTCVSIPEGVMRIGAQAFECCTMLTEISIPASVREIAYNAFDNTAWMRSQSAGCVYIGDLLLRMNGDDRTVCVRPGTTRINAHAFGECKKLTAVTLPDGLKEIGFAAFCECKKLTQINIPEGVTKIEERAFEECNSLTKLMLPSSLTEIRNCAFCCKKLKKVNIPERVTRIGCSAFSHCESLESITIPASVEEIEDDAFRYCDNMTRVTFQSSTTKIARTAFICCKKLTIHAPAGSYAEQYAKENNIPFQAL
ncbi:MAG TPA: leucine-rich repeat domain-containing protein [Candidatus Flavonifractor intestinipullorum]|uniref:Leucine-rich repeat domain-containing protein n=1 Tax=Candidatus Flavonifractor intestinipullorum TaxID=2838587 RepID=A0A9D2S608_9FIRM|nr:leucine-rich repeat domain-containing protein [Candidatus Flavonifractor intestinipullorum]